MKEYSDVHRQPCYWDVTVHEADGKHGYRHVHIKQGYRTTVLSTADGRYLAGDSESNYTRKEWQELQRIAQQYNYCLAIDMDYYLENGSIEELSILKDILSMLQLNKEEEKSFSEKKRI